MESNWDPSAYQLELTIFFFFPFLNYYYYFLYVFLCPVNRAMRMEGGDFDHIILFQQGTSSLPVVCTWPFQQRLYWWYFLLLGSPCSMCRVVVMSRKQILLNRGSKSNSHVGLSQRNKLNGYLPYTVVVPLPPPHCFSRTIEMLHRFLVPSFVFYICTHTHARTHAPPPPPPPPPQYNNRTK